MYLTSCFSLAAFRILFIFYLMCFNDNISLLPFWLCVLVWISLSPLNLKPSELPGPECWFPSQVRGVFSCYCFKYFFFLLSFRNPYNVNILLDVVPKVPQSTFTVLNSVFISLLCLDEFHCFVFWLIDSFLCLIQSAAEPLWCIFQLDYNFCLAFAYIFWSLCWNSHCVCPFLSRIQWASLWPDF